MVALAPAPLGEGRGGAFPFHILEYSINQLIKFSNQHIITLSYQIITSTQTANNNNGDAAGNARQEECFAPDVFLLEQDGCQGKGNDGIAAS